MHKWMCVILLMASVLAGKAQRSPLRATVYYRIQYAGALQVDATGEPVQRGIDTSFYLQLDFPKEDTACTELFFVWRGSQKWLAVLRNKAVPEMNFYNSRGQVEKRIKPEKAGQLMNFYELVPASATVVSDRWVAECMYKGKKAKAVAGPLWALPKLFRP